jgi:hypothetical protein
MQRGDHAEYDRLRVEQKKLGQFRPWMTHSLFEQSPSVVFHPQLLPDYVTVDEFGRTMLEQLDRRKRPLDEGGVAALAGT